MERAVDLAVVQPVAVLIHQKVALLSATELVVPPLCVICRNLTGGGMQGYQTRLSEFGSADGEHRFGPIQILSPAVQGLPQPQACRSATRIMQTLHRHRWVVYARKPFGGPEHALHIWLVTPSALPFPIVG